MLEPQVGETQKDIPHKQVEVTRWGQSHMWYIAEHSWPGGPGWLGDTVR